jgi:hypothetical protein
MTRELFLTTNRTTAWLELPVLRLQGVLSSNLAVSFQIANDKTTGRRVLYVLRLLWSMISESTKVTSFVSKLVYC